MSASLLLEQLCKKLRWLFLVPFAGLAVGAMALFVKGSQVVLEHFPLPSHKGNVDSVPGGVAIACPADLYPTFEAHILQSINFLLLGTGCLLLAIDLIDLFVQRLQMSSAMRAGSFHALKSRFANFIILAMAISFLETFAIPPALQGSLLSSPAFSSSPMLIVRSPSLW